jgi:uncharacterized protein with NRDE domain
MCLILLAYRCHPGYELIVAANRDEFYERPTAPLGFWDDAPQVLAGRDLQEQGTWMGISRTGRFAAITNYRDPSQVRSGAPSRGQLVRSFLQGSQPASDYLEELRTITNRYNGFNLLLGDESGLYYHSNHTGEIQALPAGWYGLSNHLLDTPWPKLRRGLSLLRDRLDQQSNPAPDDLLEVLTDRNIPPDTALPQTGVPLEWERWLSSIFIDAPGYGTRSSTVLLVNNNGNAHIVEMTWADASRREFQLDRH